MLKKEEWMYHFKTGPYNNLNAGESEKLLVDRVESIISADIARFAQAEYKKDKGKDILNNTTISNTNHVDS